MPPITGSFGALTARGFGLFSAPVALLDEYFENVTLLLPGNGTNGAQNNTFLDSSTNNFTITRNGNTTQGTFSPYGDNWSNYFDGTGDYLTVPDNAALQMGSGDFTIEYWWYPNNITSYQNPVDKGYTGAGALLLQTGNGDGRIIVYASGSAVITSSTAVAVNAWNHMALVRSGTTLTLYQNGASVGSATNSTNFNNTATLGIGATATAPGGGAVGAFPIVGYLSNVRFVKGTAIYSGSTYTIPSSPLTAITNTSLLTCQSNRFRDASTNNFTITVNGNTSVQRFSPFSPTASYDPATIGGSGYFDGTGDYLSVATNSAFDFGSGSFTIEGWVYINSFPAGGATTYGLSTLYASGDSDAGTDVRVFITKGSTLSGYTDGVVFAVNSTVVATSGSFTFNTGQWYHVAVTRSSNSIYIFIDGVLKSTTSYSSTIPNATTYGPSIGTTQYRGAGLYFLTGYISNVRVLKGTAQYTSTFTPPTSPVTAITNTSLLLNFTNGGIIDNAMMNNLETVGNAQISTTQSKFGGSSIAFDGTGDYLTRPGSNLFDFGTGDFTIEAWVYPAATQTQFANIICEGSTGNNWYLSFSTSNVITFSTYAATLLTSSSGLSNSTWTHVAVSRSGTSLKMFFNGTQVASATDSTSLGATAALFVGFNNSAHYFNGYIDDLRVTKGVARYTANFTPPTAAFPTR